MEKATQILAGLVALNVPSEAITEENGIKVINLGGKQ